MNNTSDDQQIQILKNIEQLQSVEKALYKELEAPTPPANPDSIITRINQLADIRISLFKSLNYTYQALQKNVNNSRTELVQLLTVVQVVEEELNNAKKQLNELYEIKHSKMRMVEINTYYGKQYQAQSRLLKLILLVGVLLLILAILWKKGFLPDAIATILLAVVIGFGGFLILWRLLDIATRDNMNFDAYNWNFDPATQKPTVYEYDKSKLLGLSGDADQSFNGLDCIGDACCTAGMKYDTAARKCIKSAALETFVTGQLTKHCFKGLKQKGGDGGSPAMPYGGVDTINFATV
jgi:uncharacterized membrane protein (DUF485 family)